jgi:CHAT domain-containing protein/tetratricopeptide (TPR) repeat protein
MPSESIHRTVVPAPGLVVVLVLGASAAIAQAPASPPAAPQQLQERDKLVKQIDELRQAAKFDQAVTVAERLMELERRTGNSTSPGVADALSRLAALAELRGGWPEAIARRKEALAIRERVDGKDHWRTADARLALAFAKTVAGFEEPNRSSVTIAFRKEQEVRRLDAQGKYAEAERVALEAMETYRTVVGAESPEVARMWHEIGASRLSRDDGKGGKQATDQAVEIRRKVLPRDHPDVGKSLHNLGIAERLLGDERRAMECSWEAVRVLRASLGPNDLILAMALVNLGVAQVSLRNFAAAKASFEEALAIRRNVLPNDDLDIAVCLTRLGIVQFELPEYAAAKASLEEALAIRRKTLPQEHPLIAESLNNLGIVQKVLGDYAAAKANHEQVLALRRKALPKDHPVIAEGLINLGNVYMALGDYAAAKSSFEEGLAIHRKALPKDHPDIARSLNNVGSVQWSLREYAAAASSFEDALAIERKALPKDHPDIARSLSNLGAVQHELRQYAAAKASLEEALAIKRKALPKDHPGIAPTMEHLGLLTLASGADPAAALAIIAEAADLHQADQLHLALAQAEPEQLGTAGESHSTLSLLLTAAQTAKTDPGPVYDRVVRGKGSVTAQQRWIRQARDAADPDTIRLLDRLHRLTQQIVGLSLGEHTPERSFRAADDLTALRALCDERARLEQQLSGRSATIRTVLGRARVGSDDVRAALPKGTSLVDFVDFHVWTATEDGKESIDEHRIAAFVLRPDQRGVVLISLGSTQVLSELIERWRTSYGAGKTPSAGSQDPSIELRKRLWEPLAPHLEGVKLVLVSPDGPLNGLPLGALPGSEEGKFLIQDYAFAAVPTPQLLPELLRTGTGQNADRASLVVGNIDFDARLDNTPATVRGNSFSPLPGTVAEASAVHDLFRATFVGRPAELLTGKEATKEGFVKRASNCSHLLVATHGFFLSEPKQTQRSTAQGTRSLESLLLHPDVVTTNPALRSGLVFAGANYATVGQGNSFLTALEASDLDLRRVDLAVLSACETGLGKVEGGEGVLGLQRAFQLAGARTTVTSLWKVPDAATQALMTRFHRNLWEKKMTKLEALREAQIWMIQEGLKHPELGLRGGRQRPDPKSHERDPVSPFYWAAFVLSGDWR